VLAVDAEAHVQVADLQDEALVLFGHWMPGNWIPAFAGMTTDTDRMNSLPVVT
jgi:hypothetical protein